MPFFESGLLLIILGAILAYFRNLPSKIYSLIERFFIIRIEIHDEDESFQWVKLWLAHTLKDSLSVSVFTRRSRAKTPEWEEDPREIYKYVENGEDKRPQIVFTPSPGWYWFFYRGKFITINKERVEPERSDNNAKPRESFSLRIFSRNLEFAKSLIEEARDFALPDDGKIEIRTCSSSYWNLTARVRPRPIDSVVLEGNVAEDILSDIKDFQKSSGWYVKRGVPYRRGYLLYGPPGSGKTSLVLSIASELDMNVNVLTLSANGMDDNKIVDLLSSVDIDTLVLIEDIDCAFSKRKTSEKKLGLTFSGILNALDGISSQDGRIVFMTTNHPEKLDPALTRPGRADVKVYIGHATQEQAYKLFRRFYPDSDEKMAKEFADSIPKNTVSMAKIQHHFMLYKGQPEVALEKKNELLKVEIHENGTGS